MKPVFSVPWGCKNTGISDHSSSFRRKIGQKKLVFGLEKTNFRRFWSENKTKNCLRDCRRKVFYFFFRETLNSDVTVSKKINFFEQTMVWRVTRGKKNKKNVGCRLHIGILCFCGERMLNRTLVYNHVPRLTILALKKVKIKWLAVGK